MSSRGKKGAKQRKAVKERDGGAQENFNNSSLKTDVEGIIEGVGRERKRNGNQSLLSFEGRRIEDVRAMGR